MRFVLSYTTEKGDKADIVAVDRSATSHGKEITRRRYLAHESTVLAARVPYLANKEEEA